MAEKNKTDVILNEELSNLIYQNIIKVEASQHDAAIKEIAAKKGFKLKKEEVQHYKKAVYDMFSAECESSGYGQYMAALWSLYRKSDQVQDYKGAKSAMDTIIKLKQHIEEINAKKPPSRRIKPSANNFKIINWERIKELASCNANISEIASYFGISRTTLYERCQKDNNMSLSEFIEEGKELGRMLLKEAMFKKAIEGNVSQQIFLSKNILGYKDKQDITTNDQSINKPVIQVINEKMAEDVSGFIDFVSKGKDNTGEANGSILEEH